MNRPLEGALLAPHVDGRECVDADDDAFQILEKMAIDQHFP